MYVPADQWSKPEGKDPPPCFRQGDVVRLRWVQPELTIDGNNVQVRALQIRDEPVALVSACCDLVNHRNPKRKGVLVSPLRDVPKNIVKNAALLAALKSTVAAAQQGNVRVPANLVYYAANGSQISESVIHLEALSMVLFAQVVSCTKIAELTNVARFDLQQRLTWHFSRNEDEQT